MWLPVITTGENAFRSVHEKARPYGNDETYGRAKLRRDITTAKAAGSGRPGVVQNTNTGPQHLLLIGGVRRKNETESEYKKTPPLSDPTGVTMTPRFGIPIQG